MNWNLMEAIEATGATPNLLPSASPVVTGISTDSRSLKKGELFIALKGSKYDGHSFMKEAVAKGAAAIMGQVPMPPSEKVPYLFVPDTLIAYGKLAGAYRKKLKARIVGITGSMGKTTTKEMAAAILTKRYRTAKTQKNENNRVGVPKTLLTLPPDVERAVIEMGSNLPGEIALLTEIVSPDCALITNIAPVHLEGFQNVEGVRVEKSALFWCSPDSTLRCMNQNDPQIKKIPTKPAWPIFSFAVGTDADLRADRIESHGLNGTRFLLSSRNDKVEITLALLGTHQVKNALAAAAIGLSEGFSLKEIKEALEALPPPKGRLEPIYTKTNWIILDDTYNASPIATISAIETLAEFNPRYVTIALLGDMLELGEKTEIYHKKVGRACAKAGIKVLGITGVFRELIRKGAIENGFSERRIFFFETGERLLEHLSPYRETPAIILVKGSHALNMHQWVETLMAFTETRGGTS